MKRDGTKRRGITERVQFKFVLSFCALLAGLIILLNSYPIAASRDLVASEKESSLLGQAAVISSSLSALSPLEPDSVGQVMDLLELASSSRVLVTDESLNVDWDGNELLLSDILGTDEDSVHSRIEKEEEKNIIRDAVSRLETRERTIIEMRFGFNDPKGREMTQKEVADKLGISQSYISRLEKKIILELKDRIAKFY